MEYRIKLPLFEGPFDLLLFFIKRDEIDIQDIPIAKITKDFLEYVKLLEEFNVELASEFILVAATLMRIKSKMLLPRPQIDEEGNEIDPREELVKHLLEYKKFKEILPFLENKEKEMFEREKRGNALTEFKNIAKSNQIETELQDVDLYKLLKIYQNVMDRHKREIYKPIHNVIPYPYTIEGQKEYILQKLIQGKTFAFKDIFMVSRDKVVTIFNLLALLELIQLKEIAIQLGEGFNNFWISRSEENSIEKKSEVNI